MDLTELLKKYKSDKEIYHDLMQFRVREILLVTTMYDAFILEQEDQLTEQIFGEYYSLNLSTAPRITSVSSGKTAIDLIQNKSFDMVIITLRVKDMTPFELSSQIKSLDPKIPVFLLLYDNNDISQLGDDRDKLSDIEKVFVWNRDSKIFLTMIKYIEDKINVDNDTKVGLVRVILLVENSIRYYSRYLPALYTEIILQTKRLIQEEHLDDVKKILRLNARPKVLMAVNYEEAINIYTKYKDYLLCLISDVKFPKDGKIDETAGVKLIQYIRSDMEDLPALLQSSDPENSKLAVELETAFINKNSQSLSADLTDFIFRNLGFGDFTFRDNAGNEIERASDMKNFKRMLRTIPDESLLYHANRNHFSSWLMARGEIQIAKQIQPVKVTDFPDAKELRNYLIDVFENVDHQYLKGKIIDYDDTLVNEENTILRLADGSFGGKGRGLAFLNMLLENTDISTMFPDVNIRIPRTAVIGTEEYNLFLSSNRLHSFIYSQKDFSELKRIFLESRLSKKLVRKLRKYLEHVMKPLAIRSSGLFEDSISESFSGVYQTYLLPNNHKYPEVRFKQLLNAIKLVYASVYSDLSRSYFDAINYKIEEEKMAVVIQEVVGCNFDGAYYPHFSGVAQSYNYYPFSHMKPSDGIAVVGAGLGKYVIDGEVAYRFCPKYPSMDLLPPEIQLKNSQNKFYAVNLKADNPDLSEGEDSTLLKLDISKAESDGTLDSIASVWDNENSRLKIGLDNPGPRIINFAPILKYDLLPLSKIVDTVLEYVKDAMGTPVEIEFSVSKEKGGDTFNFYILQIKPLIGNASDFNIDTSRINNEDLFLYTDRGMGNGKIENVCDVIYADPDKFDKSKTVEMTAELETLNEKMKKENSKYVLIAPGRWGTRDRWLGIPVTWQQISNAKIIVETGLKDFHVDASLGSHFFHNITSMNIGYFTVPYSSEKSFIDWGWLKSQKPINITEHFKHLRLKKPVIVMMDGKKGISLIQKPKLL